MATRTTSLRLTVETSRRLRVATTLTGQTANEFLAAALDEWESRNPAAVKAAAEVTSFGGC